MNGNLLLNLSPDGQGALIASQVTTLKEVGQWLEVNGEAVYGSHNWIKDSDVMPASGGGRGLVYRFTVKGDDLFAIAQGWPGETALIPALATGKVPEGKITGVTLLGDAAKLDFTQDDQGLHVNMPAQGARKYAYALKISGLKMNPAGDSVPSVMADLRSPE